MTVLEESSDFFYPMAQMFMPTVQTSSFVDMLTFLGEFSAMHCIVSPFASIANGGKHPPE